MISALKAPDKETEMISQDIFDIIPASNDFFNLGPITQAPIDLFNHRALDYIPLSNTIIAASIRQYSMIIKD